MKPVGRTAIEHNRSLLNPAMDVAREKKQRNYKTLRKLYMPNGESARRRRLSVSVYWMTQSA